jgi:protein-S-isoprenylcysteine O-methyltransferase Ste14
MTLAQRIARWRVTLGFVFAGVVLWLARPTMTTVAIGAVVAVIGEAIRIWAAGHVEKSREVTRSGPYQFTRHPLYLGSSIIGIGIAIASGSAIVAAIVIAYLAATLTAAIRADAYAARVAPPMQRAFSMQRALANREHHTVAGLAIALLLLALKVGYSLR